LVGEYEENRELFSFHMFADSAQENPVWTYSVFTVPGLFAKMAVFTDPAVKSSYRLPTYCPW
jgi:hypothetical protein